MSDDQEITAWNNFVTNSDPFDHAVGGQLRDAAIANLFMGVTNNGGYNAFLTSSWDLDANEVHRALLSVGANIAADDLHRILVGIGEPLPVMTQDERWAMLDRLWTDELDDFDVLSQLAEEELIEGLMRHVVSNRKYYIALSD